MPVQRNEEADGGLYIQKWVTGVYTQRSPMFVPISAMGIQLINRLDALWGGLNMEISSLMTLQRRPAYTRFSTTAFGAGDYPLNYYSFMNTSGTLKTVVDTPNKVYQFTATSNTAVFTKGASTRGSFFRVGDWLYYCNGTDVQKWNGTTWENWGIVAPASAPTLNFISGSLSPTSGYTYVYCYVNSTTGHVSQASPVSANTGALTNQNIVVGYTASSDPQVNQIWIFRIDDGGGNWYFLTSVANATSQYTDSTPDTGLNDDQQAPTAPNNSPCPAGSSLVTFFDGRLWVAAKNYVYWAQGGDTPLGVGEEAFDLTDNFFKLPINCTGFAPTSQGLIVATADNLYIVTGSNGVYFINIWQANFGIKTPNAIAQDGDIVFVFTSRGQCFQIGSTTQEVGFPIRNQLAAYNSSSVCISVHRNGGDEGLFLSDGSTNLWRYSLAFQAWSPVAQPTQGVGNIGSIETSLGNWTLLIGSSSGGGYIGGRNLTTWTDDGGTYACNAIVGSINVGPPGSKMIVPAISVQATITGTYPTVGVLLNEISGTFVPIGLTPRPEPTELPFSKTIWSKRHYLKDANTPLPQQVEHMQVQFSFIAENAQGEIIGMAIL